MYSVNSTDRTRHKLRARSIKEKKLPRPSLILRAYDTFIPRFILMRKPSIGYKFTSWYRIKWKRFDLI